MKETNVAWGSSFKIYPVNFDPLEIHDEAMAMLREEIKRLGIDVNVHAVGFPDGDDEGWCIHRENDLWLVYHSERGVRSHASIFTDPFAAVNFFIWWMICDPSKSNQDVGRLPKL